jgi:hypothetical protein
MDDPKGRTEAKTQREVAARMRPGRTAAVLAAVVVASCHRPMTPTEVAREGAGPEIHRLEYHIGENVFRIPANYFPGVVPGWVNVVHDQTLFIVGAGKTFEGRSRRNEKEFKGFECCVSVLAVTSAKFSLTRQYEQTRDLYKRFHVVKIATEGDHLSITRDMQFGALAKRADMYVEADRFSLCERFSEPGYSSDCKIYVPFSGMLLEIATSASLNAQDRRRVTDLVEARFSAWRLASGSNGAPQPSG